jgi:AcrR family transcriptional regulator
MSDHGGAADPARSLALLWRTPVPTARGRGPRPGLTVDRIVEAAVGLADEEGVAALSMRRVAERLGVGTASLYTYVPGKAELVEVMLDHVYGEVAEPDEPDGDWRSRVGRVARDTWALHRRHPWVLQVETASRPALGPNALAKYERELLAVSGLGLDDLDMDAVVTLVSDYVRGAARGAVGAAQAQERSGLTDEQWWRAAAPVLGRLVDHGRFPTAARVGTAAGEAQNAAYDPERAFTFGLERVLDGIEAFISSRPADRAGA